MTLNSSLWEEAFQILLQLQLAERTMGGEILAGDPPPPSRPLPLERALVHIAIRALRCTSLIPLFLKNLISFLLARHTLLFIVFLKRQ